MYAPTSGPSLHDCLHRHPDRRLEAGIGQASEDPDVLLQLHRDYGVGHEGRKLIEVWALVPDPAVDLATTGERLPGEAPGATVWADRRDGVPGPSAGRAPLQLQTAFPERLEEAHVVLAQPRQEQVGISPTGKFASLQLGVR